MAPDPAPALPRFTQPQIREMLRDLRADLAERRAELAELEASERWLTDQLEGTRRVRVTTEQLRTWAQTRPGRFTVRGTAAALGCSRDQARQKLRILAEAGTLRRIVTDVARAPEEYEFVKPDPPDKPRGRPRGGARPATYAGNGNGAVPGTGGGSSAGRPTNDKVTNEVIAAARARGWEVEDRGASLAMTSPEGERVTVHKTPGRGRALRNLRAEIRRAERGRLAAPAA